MVREDYYRLAQFVEELSFADPESAEERVWNMALKAAARHVIASGLDTPWADEPKSGQETVAVGARRRRTL